MWLQVILFLLAYLLVYSILHVILYFSIRPIWSPFKWPGKLYRLTAAVMIFLPVASRILEQNNLPELSRPLAWIGYFWMGFVMAALVVSLALWLLQIILTLFRGRGNRSSGRAWSAMVLLLSLGMLYYGYHEAYTPKLLRYEITSPKLQKDSAGIRLVQISDLHLGATTRIDVLKALVLRVKELKPDLIVSTGDMVDGVIEPSGLEIQMLAELTPRLGKYAVTGNHEYIQGEAYAVALHKNMGFKMLRGQTAELDGVINLVGMDDSRGGDGDKSEAELLHTVQNGRLTILLKHRPVLAAGTEGMFDLQLSGHTHGGQMFPYTYLVSWLYQRVAGPYPLEKNGVIYTSRGTGTWGPPFRVLAPPELTIFDLRYGNTFSFKKIP